jgi:homoprotocatechuate degradation regulator HpaR
MASKTRHFARRNLPLLLLQARESVMGKFRPVLNAHGITEQQWRVVRALLEHGPLEPRQIGEICTILSPSLTGVLARMDDLGLITRTRLDHDQRRVRVALTPKSRGLAVRIAPQVEAVYQHLEARLGADFAAQLYAALDRTIDLLQAPLDAADAADATDEADEA